MDSNFDKIRQVFSKGNDVIPPELEWSEMEKGIREKMALKKAVGSAPASSAKRRRWMLLLAFLVISVPIIWYLSTTGRTDTDASNRNTTIEENIVDYRVGKTPENELLDKRPESKATVNQNASSEGLKSSNDPNLTRLNGSPGVTRGIESVVGNAGVSVSQSGTNSRKQGMEPSTGNSLISGSTEVSLSASSAIHSSDPEKTISIASMDLTDPILEQRRSILNVRNLETIRTQLVPGNLSLMDRLEVSIDRKEDPCFCQDPVNSHRMVFLGGVTSWKPVYGTAKPERYDFERTLLSFHTQINYVHTFKNGFVLMTGLQYQRLESVFYWQKDLENHTVTLKDTIVSIQNNLITGQQTIKVADIEVPVPATRIVKHYNSTRIYSIPVAMGKSWRCRKWQMDVMAGASVNIRSGNSGKTLFSDEIIEYHGARTEFLDNRIKWNALLGGRLTYYPVARVGITAGLTYHKSLMNHSLEQDIKMLPHGMDLGVGVSFDF
jgi:hypothetical protein